MDNSCRQCGRKLTGRSDKTFCDVYCRNTYNNKVKRKSEREIQYTNSKIRKNRRILNTLCPSGKATVRKEMLDQMGFDYNYLSSLYLTKGKRLYYLVYDFGFTPLMEKGIPKALIINRQPYMDQQSWNPWKFVN